LPHPLLAAELRIPGFGFVLRKLGNRADAEQFKVATNGLSD
jgi:hypothetical protein